MLKKLTIKVIATLFAIFSTLTFQSQTKIGKSINADFSVSPTGALTYQVPFEIPSFVLGHFPDLGLAFNSQAGDGVAGYGWSIAGLSSITRTGATMHHDGFIDPVDFDLEDRFILDGQRLIVKSGTYGKAESKYVTESFSNLKIEAYGTSRFGAQHGPEYFIVYHPNGLRYWYGEGGKKSSSKLEWSISRIEDTQGNRVDFTYSLINETLRINSVEDQKAKVKVTFGYAVKQSVNPIGIGGHFFTNNRLLKNVYVKVNNATNYYHYQINHSKSSYGVDRIDNIVQKNRNGEALPKLQFKHFSATESKIKVSSGSVGSQIGDSQSSAILSGDFNGDEELDFIGFNKTSIRKSPGKFSGISYHRRVKGVFGSTKENIYSRIDLNNVGKFEEVFTANYLNTSNKLSDKQGVVLLRRPVSNSNLLRFEINSINDSNSLEKEQTVTWYAPTIPSGNTTIFDKGFTIRPKTGELLHKLRYVSGDFNGDGISDLIAINSSATKQLRLIKLPRPGGGPIKRPRPFEDDDVRTVRSGSRAFFIDFNTNNKAPDKGIYNFGGNININKTTQILTGDYDGDGRTDLFVVFGSSIKIYSLNRNNNRLVLKTTIKSNSIHPKHPLLIGDYNGDGKTDIVTPTENKKSTWAFFISNGKSFTTTYKDIGITFYTPHERREKYNRLNGGCPEVSCYTDSHHYFNYIPIDYNKDGKTDIIAHKFIVPTKQERRDFGFSKQFIDYSTNISTEKNYLSFSKDFSKALQNKGKPYLGHSAFANFDKRNLMNEYAYLDYAGNIDVYSYTGFHRAEVCIENVTNNGLKQKFEYTGVLDSKSPYRLITPYTASFSEPLQYPCVEVKNANDFKIITRVTEQFNGLTRSKSFRYAGLVSSVNGLGLLGFNYMASSDWEASDYNAFWTYSEYDVKKRGVLKRTWTHNSSPQPNTVSFPSSNFVSKTSYDYEYKINSDKTFISIPKRVTTTDGLTGVETTVNTTYDSYYNAIKSIQTYSGGSKAVTSTFANNPTGTGKNYYIGRPLSKKEVTSLGSEVFSNEERYSYANNFISSLKTKGHKTNWLTETYTHDSFGNITSKTIAADGITRKESSTYDPSGRFMLSNTDIEGLTATYKYDTILGHLIEEKDPFGKTQKFTYDGWNRLTKQTDYLGNTISTKYLGLSGGGLKITTTSSLGGGSETNTNRLGWETHSKTRDLFFNKLVSVQVDYDAVGRAKRESQPFFGDNGKQWTYNYFDDYNRPIRQKMYNGQTITTTYNGLSVTVNDGTKTKSITKDAIGNTISLTDEGGTISYKYYANNTPKETNYEGHKITTKIDGWGRKTELNDPAAGLYKYKYNIFGELLEEYNVNGTTTYKYNTKGKVTEKKIKGKNTDLSLKYTYDGSHKQITNISGKDLVNNNDYTYKYRYDNKQRPIEISEVQKRATFIKKTVYDAKGRLATEKYTSKTYIKKLYENDVNVTYSYHTLSGQLIKLSDADNANKLLWEAKANNERGQLTNVRLGNKIKKSIDYDDYGFPVKIEDHKTFIKYLGPGASQETIGANVLSLTNTFDTKRGNLLSRVNTFYYTGENFGYDDLDRLTEINGAQTHKHSYDKYGRIANNTNIGTYNYQANTRYRVAGIDLNKAGDDYYKTHSPQTIKYNAFKKPVNVKEKDNEVKFEYGPLMNRTVAHYNDKGITNKWNGYTKVYSSIFPAEILQDRKNNNVKIITYVGGDAYTAPIAHVSQSNKKEKSGYMYLHRDHLGSIMAITDQDANIVEQTHYGAWGTIDKFKSSANNAKTLDYKSLLGRGYTGHEHFTSIGLIHMNGRMYDAKLGRFLSPDNFIQDPFNTQSFNRFGYVWNNPLKYNDPSGEVIFLTAIIIGAVVGAYLGGAQANGSYNPLKWKANAKTLLGVLGGAVVGAVGGQVGAAVGAAALTASGIAGGIAGGAVAGAAGGLVGGAITGFGTALLPGGSGKPLQGALMGAATGFIGGAIIGGVVGGVQSGIKGNNIWNGDAVKKTVVAASSSKANSLKSTVSDNLDESLNTKTTSSKISESSGITKGSTPSANNSNKDIFPDAINKANQNLNKPTSKNNLKDFFHKGDSSHALRKASNHLNPSTFESKLRTAKLFQSVVSDPNSIPTIRIQPRACLN